MSTSQVSAQVQTLTKPHWLGALAFAVLIGLSAQLSFDLPGTTVPQTAQTIVVLLAGAFLGFSAASLCIVLYLFAGLAGLPVFANGGSGANTLFGPTGGYLIGFWMAACLLGYLADIRKLRRPVWRLFVWMLLAHMTIVATGGLLLSFTVGLPAAWFNGVQPFIVGAVVKSVIAACIVLVAGVMIRRQ
ncbi:MAG: biotin transporter BioY [Pseudomonadota bacterium]